MILQQADLFFQSGTSDKVYHLQLNESSDPAGKLLNTHSVTFQYGRRGSALNEGTKITGATFEVATKVFNKILNEKLGKGYQGFTGDLTSNSYQPTVMVPAPTQTARPRAPATRRPAFSPLPKRVVDWDDSVPEISLESGVPGVQRPADIIFIPQLLNVIEESDIEAYLLDNFYCAQEKKDGRHQPFHKRNGEVIVTNKKGKAIGYPEALRTAIQTPKDLLVDAEIIGDTFHAFDLLELHGEDLRGKSYEKRYEALETLFSLSAFDSRNIVLVPIAKGYRAKKALYSRLKAEGKEGIVFKLLDAPYTPGKAHTAMYKCKFYSTVSARVVKGREGKHSIGLELLSIPNGDWLFMGNCTIPPNKDIPEIGSIVEIKMLYCNKGGSFYQPSYLGVRDDVDAEECLLSQVKYKPEE